MDAPPAYILYAVAGLAIIVLGYFIYKSVEPSEWKALSKARPIFDAYSQVTRLAPLGCPIPVSLTNGGRLCDYYMAASSYSVFPGTQIYDYVSDSILPLVVKAGARLVELDIYAEANTNVPVVGLKNQKLGTDYAYNTVPFEACCVSICNNAFNSVITPVASDPFILSCNFHTNDAKVLAAAAEILKTTCGQFLLGVEYGYQRKNLAIEPVCNLQRKLVVVSGGNEIKGTMFEELVNLSWDTSSLRRLTYTQASQPHDYKELVDFNRNRITMVIPDSGVLEDGLTNYNPTVLFTYGCQWTLMNYGSLDTAMELYIGNFQENSCVLKPAQLRPLVPKKYKQPTLPDPSVSFQPMRQKSPIYDVTV